MTDKLPFKIYFYRLMSAVLITLERVRDCFWQLFVFAGFFVAMWLFQIPVLLGLFGEGLAFIAFFAGVGYFLWRDGRGFSLPRARDIDRRIEVDSMISGRPLSGLHDRLINPQEQTARDLWEIAKTKLKALLPLLKPARLRSFMMENDPYALRFGVLMALILGVMLAGPDAGYRIRNGLMPFSLPGMGFEKRDQYTLWVTPPAYTKAPQFVLTDKTMNEEILKIPQGSTLKAIVHGGWGAPTLHLGERIYDFIESADRSYGLELEVPLGSGELSLKQTFRTLAHWDYEVTPDEAPKITAGDKPPVALENGELQFSVSVYDDYSVQYLNMRMKLDEMVADAPLGVPAFDQRSVASPAAQDFGITPVYDLTSHPWAGLPVVFEFEAMDQIGQSGHSPPIKAVLPERVFRHPVAKTLIALRKRLAWQPEAAIVYAEISYDLEVLLTAKDMLHNDVVAYLGIRSAASRLGYNLPSIETTRSVMSLLWDTALRIEDGDLTLASRKLRDAQQALEDALKNPDITNDEVSALMDDLREAMGEYFSELSREMQKRAENGEPLPMISPDMMNNALNAEALSKFLEQMEESMRSGDIETAQEMLSQMQRLMDMLNPSMQAQMPEDMQMMQQGISELEELIKRQEALLGQTLEQAKVMEMMGGLGFDYGQSLPEDQDLMQEWGMNELPPAPGQKKDGTTPEAPFVNTQGNKVEQEALRYILGQLMLDVDAKIGEIPQSMGLAEQEMRASAQALALNQPPASVPHQEQAITYLRESQKQLAQQLQKRLQQMTGFMIGFGGKKMQYDPLGRPYGSDDNSGDPSDSSNVKIPDEAERRRVEEILQLLRERSSEQNRPREELEYYRRLLKRF